ncbi:MAG: DUF503 domain-containing protein [Chloroflexi bacterium]|nr:DUF503 domain-containing protein [Chloroflexota bacterium]
MVIGTCVIELRIPGNGSLKGKRRVVKSIIARVHNEFNVSIGEVDDQDFWQSAVLGVACVSNGTDYVHGLLTKVVEWIETNRPDVEVVDYRIEMF